MSSIFEAIVIWEPYSEPVPVEVLTEGMSQNDAKLISLFYEYSQDFYKNKPPRKNGQSAFTHPTNVAYYLKKAEATPYMVGSGLLHDRMEDGIDEIKTVKGTDPFDLDRVLWEIRGKVAEEIVRLGREAGLPQYLLERIVEVVWTLTRHKADRYYKSISAIFTHVDHEVKIPSVLVKLADRMHNIQTIENYKDSEKIYQCFKNLFILNNAKQMMSTLKWMNVDSRMRASFEKLFKKCGKATFNALFDLVYKCKDADSYFPLKVYLALAFRKYMWDEGGLEKVTKAELKSNTHIAGLYDGIVEKYDAFLHHEHAKYRTLLKKEIDYCIDTFSSFDLNIADFDRIIYFKDAMALMEVIGRLLYEKNYRIKGFSCVRLCSRGRNCMQNKKTP